MARRKKITRIYIEREFIKLFGNLYLGEAPKPMERVIEELICYGSSEQHFILHVNIVNQYIEWMSKLSKSKIFDVQLTWESTNWCSEDVDHPCTYICITFFFKQDSRQLITP